MNWQTGLKGVFSRNEPLKNKTTFKIGGAARFFIEPRDDSDLKFLLGYLKKGKVPTLVIGGGSNILAGDGRLGAAVIRLSSEHFKKISHRKCLLELGAGTGLKQAIEAARKYSLTGLEFLTGIPGTAGGALIMNAGAWGSCIGELVEEVKVIDYNGLIKILKKDELKFGYRKSNLGKYIILSFLVKLKKARRKEIEELIRENLIRRRKAQDATFANAGCVFKNPGGLSAGRLIDLCGLKGKRIGGAIISKKHANFILNRRNAKALDVLRLMELAKKEVKNKFNINLEPEIKIWR